MNNNDLFQASRRRFLAQLGGLTVAGMLGPSLLTPRRATAAQAATEAVISKEGILTGSHWGAIRATVKDGRFVAAKPFELDKYPSKMIAGLPDHVHNAARIRYPMVRVDWLRKRHLSDTSQRGDNRFVRVSWDEALDMFYEELERVQKTHGPSALLTPVVGNRRGCSITLRGCWRKLLPCMVIALVRAEITLPVLRR